MASVQLGSRSFTGVKTVRFNTPSGGYVIFENYDTDGPDNAPAVIDNPLWAYLDRHTLYLKRADDFIQNGTVLEVCYG